ncbi:P-loop containing nucleoside triphosphate hydrolase protein [Dioscorea alata]|uniref:P-loop containing nucleoside triphosphate hydrolase protein n=1 Tax=Dioscorea alata TaxID=55571 RepID=A0ACB7UNS6_DIOAL|nr:P-loop containing nucleoside triphosphate hydrolase protein [Dioscorea alata]
MVTISQNKDLNKIQTEIAECLGFHLNEESVEVRAAKLADRLTTTKNKVLVILDDLWEKLDLSKVRIPRPQMGTTCTVVITTRNEYVCERMSCQEIIELKTLSDEESWCLFKRRTGDAVESTSSIRKLAQKVARECAGLPLALVVLGTALKGEGSPEIWKTVLMQLRQSMEMDLLDVSKEVFQPIKLSFDYIKSEVAKSCLFHCCLYPEDWDIPKEELMHMMVGGGLLIGLETLNDAQGRVDLLLNQLKARALLLQGSSEGYVRMHDVVRDVAIQISAKDHGFYVQAGQGWRNWPENIDPNCRRLSLMGNDIQDLRPDPMEYPILETLILRGNTRLSSIPETFFRHMGSLMVLDLSSTGIESLPESFSFPTNLKVLNLGNCGFLQDISHINGLKKLAILILEGCPVSIAPECVAWAQNLRFVNLGFSESHPSSLDIYFSKVLPSCRRLEQLSMNKFVGSFQGLISLRHLTRLFIFEVVDFDNSLSHEIVLEGSWPDQHLKFDICFLERRRSYLLFSSDRRVLQLKRTRNLANWVKELLQNTVSLLLAEFPQTELIAANSEIPLMAFTRMEHLQIVNWANLEVFIRSEGFIGFVNQLKYLTIDNCPRITWAPASWEYTMPKLEELRVTNCPVMKELLQFDYKSPGPRILLPSLKILELYGLHKLRQGVLQLFQCLPKLKDSKIHDCGVKCVLSFSFSEALPDPLPTLAKLHIENCPEMIEIIFVTDAPNAPNASLQAQCCFQGLMHLTIESCPRLSHLFSYKQAISMQNLRRLYIRDCAALGAVVISQENEEKASATTSTSATTATSASTSTHVAGLPIDRLTGYFYNIAA